MPGSYRRWDRNNRNPCRRRFQVVDVADIDLVAILNYKAMDEIAFIHHTLKTSDFDFLPTIDKMAHLKLIDEIVIKADKQGIFFPEEPINILRTAIGSLTNNLSCHKV